MREVLQTRNRAFGPNGVPTTSRQTSATRTDTTSRLPISLGSTNKRYEPSELRFYFTLAGDAIAQLIVILAKRPRSRKRRNTTRPRRRSVEKIVVIGTGRMGGAFATDTRRSRL